MWMLSASSCSRCVSARGGIGPCGEEASGDFDSRSRAGGQAAGGSPARIVRFAFLRRDREPIRRAELGRRAREADLHDAIPVAMAALDRGALRGGDAEADVLRGEVEAADDARDV